MLALPVSDISAIFIPISGWRVIKWFTTSRIECSRSDKFVSFVFYAVGGLGFGNGLCCPYDRFYLKPVSSIYRVDELRSPCYFGIFSSARFHAEISVDFGQAGVSRS